MPNCPRCEHELTRREIGVLYAALGSRNNRATKLTAQDVDLIRQSDEPIGKLAKKHKVSFQTIWRIKNNKTHKGQYDLNCQHCGKELTPQEISRLFASLGGSTSSPKKTKANTIKGRKASKLTEQDIADIRQSNASTRELARKYKVLLATIRKYKRK